jgi:hypothetical protein
MSRRNPHPVEILMKLPWQVSAVLAVVVYIGLRWVLPAISSDNSFLNVFIRALSAAAWIPALVIGVIAIVSAVRAKRMNPSAKAQSFSAAPSEPSCPQCGGAMVQRVARKGANTGNSFWGCTNFPKCRGVR